jgi:hypothetical protein
MQNKNFSPEFFEALVTLNPDTDASDIRKCHIEELSEGMIVEEEIRTHDGSLISSKGQEVTSAMIFKLKNFHARRAIAGTVTVSLPTTSLAFVKGAS